MTFRRAYVLPSLLLSLSLVVGCSDSVESRPPIDDTGSISEDTGADTNVDETAAETGDDATTDETATDATTIDAMDSGDDTTIDSGDETTVDSGADTAVDTETDSGPDAVDASDADDAADAPDAADAADAADAVDTAPACSVGADCPGVDTECAVRTCTLGVCGVSTSRPPPCSRRPRATARPSSATARV